MKTVPAGSVTPELLSPDVMNQISVVPFAAICNVSPSAMPSIPDATPLLCA
jgi:hypothetical protein